jgi:rod shape-determining protein MreD
MAIGLSSLHQQKPPLIKALPAYCLNVVLLLMSVKTLDFVAIENVHVIFFLAPLFYWTVHNPFVLPLWFIFLSGLFIDFLTDGLLGLHAFSFLVYYIILYRTRRIILSQPPLYQFMVFSLTALVFECLRWLTLTVLMWQWWDFFPSLVAVVINIVVFPIIILVLKFTHRIMSGYGRNF